MFHAKFIHREVAMLLAMCTETIVGVNKYRPDNVEKVDVLSIDNSIVREKQIARINKTRQSRDQAVVCNCSRAYNNRKNINIEFYTMPWLQRGWHTHNYIEAPILRQ